VSDTLDDDLFGAADDGDPDLFAQDGPDLFGTRPDELIIAHEPEPVTPEEIDVELDEMDEIPIDPDEDADASDSSEASEGQPTVSLALPPRDTRPHSTRPDAPLALYRRYRPDTFAEMIGQDHVTEPLRRALVNNRVNHAYLFSGPRGCGKTTSARILARCLNCEQGPTPEPCGVCQSCRDLARGGTGSIDVIEIDAASHGGVNEARDLRERAFFSPVHSRYKIYIIDEAHMVTKEGFNALLKLVEEPPPHVKFIFATTEPEKVLGTIRSRTHHYPFRLVPPKVLAGYLDLLCEKEGVTVDKAVLPLVVRAGAGSVRDSLSVLDQLLGGAGERGVSYRQATALLGYTPDTLLDEIMDAFAAGDAEGVFACVDKVIEVGQDPRRFAEDLLRRLRDLIIVAAVPDSLTSGLVDVSGDQAERLTVQAQGMGAGELTRAAEVIAKGLTDMRGTTAPRLYLELMCARVLLPGADVDARGIHARLDRLERRLHMVAEHALPGSVPQSAGTAAPIAQPAAPAASGGGWASDWTPDGPDGRAGYGRGESREQAAPQTSGPDSDAHAPVRRPSAPPPVDAGVPADDGWSAPAKEAARAPRPAPVPEPEPPTAIVAPTASEVGGLGTADVRRMWPQVLEAVKGRRRVTWIVLSQNAQVHDFTGGVLTMAMNSAGARESFGRGGSPDVLREALIQVLGIAPTIETIVGVGQPPERGATPERPPTGPAGGGSPRGSGQPPAPASAPESASAIDASGPNGVPASGVASGVQVEPVASGVRAAASPLTTSPTRAPSAQTPEPPPEEEEDEPRPDFAALARENIRKGPAAPAPAPVEQGRGDLDLDSSGIEVDELLTRELGAELLFDDPEGH
jgi:DNA polymerase III subunit gamma/tau